MLMINLPQTSKVAIVVGGFTGNKSVYIKDLMIFLDIMGYAYAFITGEIHLIERINDEKKKKDLEKLFVHFKTDKGLPPWLGIKIE